MGKPQTSVNTFDDFARAISTTESSSLGYSKTDTTSYADDTTNWVLGLVTQTTTGGTVVSQTNYNSLDLPTSQCSFGRLVSTSVWNSDGTLASISEGGPTVTGCGSAFSDGRTTTFSGWYRGVPEKITYADGHWRSAAVNGDGWITSVTDENDFTTSYSSDAMGRVTEIDYPSGPGDSWNKTLLSFAPVSGTELGIPSGHWKQVVQTGNGYTVTYFDAYWRPLVTERYDAGNTSGTLSQTVKRYDADGRDVFTSIPTRSATSYTQSLPGTHTIYDALNRITEIDQDSSLGLLPTTTQYLSGFRTAVTKPNQQGTGVSTVTSYQAYGVPTTQWPVSITAPMGEVTTIARDVFGKPLSITRNGSTCGAASSVCRSFAYNAYQQLCGRTEPETGTTMFGYDGGGNLLWSVPGLPATSGCYSLGQVQNSGRMVSRTYDARNRLTSIAYADNFSNTSYGYAPDGALLSQSVSNGGFPVTTAFSYDERRLLTSETLCFSAYPCSSNAPTFVLGYGYDANGHLATTTYPDGRSLAYAPNALGQPTEAGTYATGVTYYPNGAIAGFTYGNGVVHIMTETPKRGLVGTIEDAINPTSLDNISVEMEFSYLYDGDGNVAAITDGLSSTGSVDMTYDALDRLSEADSSMFGGTASNPGKALYGYDVFNNLTAASVGSLSSFNYGYNAQNQLANLTDPSNGTPLVTYTYDAQGNLANKSGQSYQFDLADRLESVPGLASYRYDAAGRRVQKTETQYGKELDSDYSQAGNLMYQWDPAMVSSTDYIYLGSTMVARVVGNKSTVIGNIDGVPTASSPSVGGWACSTGVAASISVEIFAGPSGGGGVRLGTMTANQASEAAVGASCGTTGANHRFTFALTDTMRSQYAGAAIYVYGDSPVGNGNLALTNSGKYTIPANPAAPPAPASISVPSSSTTGNIAVSWSAASTATSYVLQQQLNGGAWTQAYSGSSTSTNLSGLGNGNYVYQVQACNSVGCSASTVSSTLTVALIPAPPASINVPSSSYSASFSVSWNASANASNYVLEESINGGSWGVAFNGDATSTTVTVSASGTYRFQVSACGAGGCSGFTTSGNIAVTLKPATAPSLSGPSSSTTGTFTLTWTAVAGTTRYQLNQNLGGQVTSPYNAGGTSWTSSNLANGNYNYQVFACNAAGCGPGSNGVSVSVLHIPPTPASVSAPPRVPYPGNAWSITIAAATGASSYNLRRTNVGSTGSPTITMTGVGTTATDYTTPGTYQYAAQACNASGCSGWQNAGGTTTVFCAETATTTQRGVSPDILKCGGTQ